jgi:hypothetical protein
MKTSRFEKLFYVMLALLAILLFLTLPVHASSIAWDASTCLDPDPARCGTIQYRVWFTDQDPSLPWKWFYNAGENLTVPLDSGGNPMKLHFGVKYYFRVSAYNAAGESGLSNMVDFTMPAFVCPPDQLPPDPPINKPEDPANTTVQ